MRAGKPRCQDKKTSKPPIIACRSPGSENRETFTDLKIWSTCYSLSRLLRSGPVIIPSTKENAPFCLDSLAASSNPVIAAR
jgi:hypothetical protein